MNSLTVGKQPRNQFLWKDRKHVQRPVSTMETSHLFHVIKMVWNHTAPEHLRIEPYRRYRFGSFYTKEYIIEAIRMIAKELDTRDDLADNFKKQLDFMSENFYSVQKHLESH